MSLIYSTYLQDSVEWTDSEKSIGKKYLDYDELTRKWETIELHWDEIFILLEIKRGGGSPQRRIEENENPWYKVKEQLGVEKSEKLIKLYCKINGIDYEKKLEKKENIKILVNDFVRFIDTGINVKVDVKK